MTSTRMNAAIRDGMVEKALETSGYNAERRALITTTATFAEKVRQVILADEGTTDEGLNARWGELKNSQDSYFFYVSMTRDYDSTHFNINLGGMDVYLYLDGRNHSHSQQPTFLTAAFKEGQKTNRCWVPRRRAAITDDALKQEFLDIENLWNESVAKRDTIRANVAAAVGKFRTIEKLLEAWPEAKDLLPDAAAKTPGTAVALDVKSLNAICGVPAGK